MSSMDADEVNEMFEKMLDIMGADMLLNDMYIAMTTDQAQEILEHVARMNDIEL